MTIVSLGDINSRLECLPVCSLVSGEVASYRGPRFQPLIVLAPLGWGAGRPPNQLAGDPILSDDLDVSFARFQESNSKLNLRNRLDEKECTVCETDLERRPTTRLFCIADEVDGFSVASSYSRPVFRGAGEDSTECLVEEGSGCAAFRFMSPPRSKTDRRASCRERV